MKSLFALTAAAALLAACGNDASTSSKPQTDSVPVAVIDTLDRFDTITANGYTIMLLPATEADFNVRDASEWRIPCGENMGEKHFECMSKWLKTQLETDSAFVSRPDSLTLRIKLSKNGELLFRDTLYTEGGEGSTRMNEYAGKLYGLPWVVVGRTYYEAFDAAIYNLNTGQEVPLHYYPVLSPQKNWLLVYNFDLEAGYTFNGLQLVNLNGNNATPVFEKLYERWGPTNVKWVSANEAVIEQSIVDYSSPEYKMIKYYARLVIKENK